MTDGLYVHECQWLLLTLQLTCYMHVHKECTDSLNEVGIAIELVGDSEHRLRLLANYSFKITCTKYLNIIMHLVLDPE